MRADSERLATEDLQVAAATDPGDYFTFQSQRTTQLDRLTEATAVRYRVKADLAGRRFEEFNLDIGFSEVGDLPQEILRGPEIFRFAEIPPVEVPTLPLIWHVAEKLHAYERVYAKERRSTRVKDLVDLALICSMSSCKAGALRDAIQRTFATRPDQDPPMSLARPPDDWRLSFETMARETGLHPDLDEGHRMVAAFLDPVLGGALPAESRWNPTHKVWGPVDTSDST